MRLKSAAVIIFLFFAAPAVIQHLYLPQLPQRTVTVSQARTGTIDFAQTERRLAKALSASNKELASPSMEKAMRYGAAVAARVDSETFPEAMAALVKSTFPEQGEPLSALLRCFYYYVHAEASLASHPAAVNPSAMGLDIFRLQDQYFGKGLAQTLFANYRDLYTALEPSNPAAGTVSLTLHAMPISHGNSCDQLDAFFAR